MLKSVVILSGICILLQLMAGFYRIPSALKLSPDMESLVCFPETEEIKKQSDDAALMEEHALAAHQDILLLSTEKSTYFIRCTPDLPWQHTDAPLLPPELSFCLL